jgi:ParB family chromosome partitioning protein
VVALVVPDARLQYKILALNVEKVHNLREKSLEVIRMYRGLPAGETEVEHAFEFEEPHFVTLGVCYERNGRFGGGAYAPLLRRVDAFLDQPLGRAIEVREARATKVERLDAAVARKVKELQARGMESPYLKAFVLARSNPLRFQKSTPAFDEALDDIARRVERFNVERVRAADLAATGGPPSDGAE